MPCFFLGISCQYNRSKHLKFQYIYRICYKNAKKAEPNDPAFGNPANDLYQN